jgi:hypothetical protein
VAVQTSSLQKQLSKNALRPRKDRDHDGQADQEQGLAAQPFGEWGKVFPDPTLS